MRRFALAAALAVLALGASGTSPNLVVDCSRAFGDAAASGDCDEFVPDVPDPTCETPPNCPLIGGVLLFHAVPARGFTFTGWSHPQCGPPDPLHDNACAAQVAPGGPFPPLTVTATFADTEAPSVTLTAPADRAVVRGTVPLTATATDNAGLDLVFRVRGNPLPQTFEVPPFRLDLATTGLADGPAEISATATDAAGHATASRVNVTIDNTNPTLTLTGPDGVTLGPPATPTWAIDARDATSAVTVRCSVVPVGQAPAFGACTSATQERLADQPDGRYTLTVRATDAAGNFVDQARTFGIDTGPPETTIASGPGDGAGTTETALSWGFGASEASTFQCRLFLTAIGPGPFGACSAAASHSVAGLAPGAYTFEVRATDAFGNVDPTPAHRTVNVTLAPPAPPAPVPPLPELPPSPAPPGAPPVPRIVLVTVTFSYHGDNRRATKLSSLVVNSVPTGATVTAVCPRGCARKRLVVHKPSRRVSLKRLTGAKHLKPRTKITVTVSKPGAIAAVKVLEIRSGKPPTVDSFCRPPGASRPRACA